MTRDLAGGATSAVGGSRPLRTAGLTMLALVAFAANSVLCRLALGEATIDAATFSTVRLTSGAAVLLLLSRAAEPHSRWAPSGDWRSAALLFLYAAPFSFAYVTLSTGTGALILFGAVQAAMILAAVRSGERPLPAEWLGLVVALAGLAYLVSPGLAAPTPVGSALMAAAGVSWGVYTLRGRGRAAVASTTGNFVRSVPFVLGLSLVMWPSAHISPRGAVLAGLSGSLTSGVGYVIWYAALPGLTATRAAIVQLPVPVLAALGGVVFLSEEITLRLVLSAVLILGGVGLAILSRRREAA